jgi:hypothetical protein
MYIGCLIMTKQHYLSPFLEVNEESRTVRLYKPARNGCFEKSLGSSKHRFAMLTYDRAELVEDVVGRVKNYPFDTAHLILLFGTKSNSPSMQGRPRGTSSRTYSPRCSSFWATSLGR